MDWFKLALAIAQIALLILQKAERKGVLKEGQLEQLKALREKVDELIAKGDAAAAAVDHSRLPDVGEDPYRRD